MKEALLAAVLAGMVTGVTSGLAQVTLVRAMMTRSVPTSGCTPAPSAVNTFLTSDPSAFFGSKFGAPQPAINAGGVLNGADDTPEIAPGMMVSIFGWNPAPRTVAAQAAPLPLELEGVSVEVTEAGKGAVRAPLYFVSPGADRHPDAVRDHGIAGRGARARGCGDERSGEGRRYAARTAPFHAHHGRQGRGDRAACANLPPGQRGLPAAAGGYLILYVTGLGEVSPPSSLANPGGDGGGTSKSRERSTQAAR